MSRKSGTGSKEKELIDRKMLKINWVSPISPQKMYAKRMLIKRKEKATGIPKKKRKINEDRMMIKSVTQSIVSFQIKDVFNLQFEICYFFNSFHPFIKISKKRGMLPIGITTIMRAMGVSMTVGLKTPRLK